MDREHRRLAEPSSRPVVAPFAVERSGREHELTDRATDGLGGHAGHAQGQPGWGSLWAVLHDWSTQIARSTAGTAEEELAIDWQRHCDLLRHEQPRAPRTGAPARTAGTPRAQGR